MATTKAARVDRAKQDAARVRAYFAALPPDTRRALKQLRETVRAAAPGTTEVISYAIPAIALGGKVILWYAAWKSHVSLYPMSAAMKREHGASLRKYVVSKGTIRFPLDEPLPVALVRRLVKARLTEARELNRPQTA